MAARQYARATVDPSTRDRGSITSDVMVFSPSGPQIVKAGAENDSLCAKAFVLRGFFS